MESRAPPTAANKPPARDETKDEVRRQMSFLVQENKTYLAPITFDDTGMYHDPGLFGAAPWFDELAAIDDTSIPIYASNGFIPGSIQLSAMKTES